MKKVNFKKIIRQIHLWLGLTSGIIVFIVAITGCLYAFQEEILNTTESFRFVEKQDKPFLLPSVLEKKAKALFPNKQLHAIKYNGPEKSAEAIFYHYQPDYYFISYINPYDGKILKTTNQYSGFFRFILDGHFYLWLPHDIGQTVIASATLIFLSLLISGLILWFPKNKKAAKQRFWFKWKATTKWKRKNYDFHNITGFYILAIGLIFAITGLVWGFSWFANGFHKIMGGEKPLEYIDPVSTKNKTTAATPNNLDKVYHLMMNEYPNAAYIEVHPAESATSCIAANANLDEGTFWETDYRYFDQYTLKELSVDHLFGRLQNAGFSDKVIRMNYDIHTGAILGIPGKLFAFLVSLLIASLPISGFLVWWGRNQKE